jgi:hypothetical protein
VDLSAGSQEVEIRIESGVDISGRVVAESGEPIAGSTVALRGNRRPLQTTTDTEGFFRLEAEAGIYDLRATARGYASARLDGLRVEASDVSGLELRLSAGGSIRGRITGVSFDELPRVSVQARGSTDWATSSVDYEGGYALLALAPGEWQVTARHESTGATANALVRIAAGEEAVVDLELDPGLLLTGSVKRETEPVIGAQVTLQGIDVVSTASVRTDYQGHFQIGGLSAGRYRLLVGGGSASFVTELDLQEHEDITIELATASIEGLVLDAESSLPIAGARLQVQPIVGDDGSPPRFGYGPGPQKTDDRGRFVISDVPDGRYRLSATQNGYATASVELAIEGGGDPPEIVLALERGAALTLRLASPAGVPANVMVAVLDGTQTLVAGPEFRSVGADGRLELDMLQPGDFELIVQGTGFGGSRAAAVRLPVRVPSGEMDVVLPYAASLEVLVPELRESVAVALLTVAGANGRPFTSFGAGSLRSGFRVERGRVEVGSLPPGAWTLEAATSDGRRWQGTVAVQEGERASVVLSLAAQ